MNRSAREYQQRPKKNGWQTRLHKGAKKTCRDGEARGAPQGAASRGHSLWQREERREAQVLRGRQNRTTAGSARHAVSSDLPGCFWKGPGKDWLQKWSILRFIWQWCKQWAGKRQGWMQKEWLINYCKCRRTGWTSGGWRQERNGLRNATHTHTDTMVGPQDRTSNGKRRVRMPARAEVWGAAGTDEQD